MIARKLARIGIIKQALKACLLFIQKLRLRLIESQSVVPQFYFSSNALPRLFNLDVHISVIGDLRQGLNKKAHLTTFSVSQHNWATRKLLKMPDPVEIINDSTWKNMGTGLTGLFAERYSKFLKSFDGFIACYPIPMVQVFEQFEKPIFAQIATRYEAPYTLNRHDWDDLNACIQRLVHAKMIQLHANNRADLDYFQVHTGEQPHLLPSLCDYTNSKWIPSTEVYALTCIDSALAAELTSVSDNLVLLSELFPHGYQFKEFAKLRGIVCIPYQVSTMTLFECATMGLPVLVPSPNLIKSWIEEGYSGILSQISFDPEATLVLNSNQMTEKSGSINQIDWWLSRADYYNQELMPNVRIFNDLEELKSLLRQEFDQSAFLAAAEKRNTELRATRASYLDEFLKAL